LFSTILLIIHCSDLGAYQQPARESLSTFQDVTVAGVGKKIVFFYFLCVSFCYPLKYFLKSLARTISDFMTSYTMKNMPYLLYLTNIDPYIITGSKSKKRYWERWLSRNLLIKTNSAFISK